MDKDYLNNIPTHQPKYPVQTLEKALDIIELLKSQSTDEGLGISDLSEMLNIGKSTIHRLLDTLVAYQYVEKTREGKYRLNWRLYQIGNALPQQRNINNVDIKVLKQLSDTIAETVNLGVRDGRDVVVVSKIDPDVSTRIKVDFRIGEREPFHCTAMGKVLFSELEEAEIRKIVEKEGLPRLTENTICSFHELMKELRKVRKKGFALDEGEFCNELSCIAMPLRNFKEKIIAAVSVSGPSFRLRSNKITKVIEELEQTTESLSRDLGYQPK